jgi:uncharacterized protein (TIGR02391 family)
LAKRRQTPEPKQAELKPDMMKTAIPMLRKRIEELNAFDVSTVKARFDPSIQALEHKVNDTLAHIFGYDSVEYRRYDVRLDTADISAMYETPLHEVIAGYGKGIKCAISNLNTIIELFAERLELSGISPASRARDALATLDLHPEIERAVSTLFQNGHYANAVEDACKVLDGLVKIRSGKFDLSGTDLMQTVFSPKSPALAFNPLQSESDKSEQQGMMFLYAGAMLALRNPRAHEIVEDDPGKALELIAFLSFLAKSLDSARRTS